ncbi:MAG: efflux RND transporter permease subunit [Longimicrobiales bacterium]|nr:efflux RND transporter permease subunit [Longimicrobiales bacterium]
MSDERGLEAPPRNEAERRADASSGPVAYMARHGVAANLLLVFLFVAGFVAFSQLVQEVFPEFSLDTIQITVPYPGANPDEVEEAIVRKIEEAIEAVEGIDEINAVAAEGLASVTVELELGTDIQKALDDIKTEVDQIQTFPVDADRPEVRELTNRQSVIRLAVSGNASERTLKEIAYATEDALAILPEVSFVTTSGIRPYEISIEVPRDRLRALGLTLPDIAEIVRRGSLDLSAGSIDTSSEEVRIRTLGQNYTQQEFEEIVVIARPGGTVVRLGEIATVIDGFEDTDLVTRYNGSPAAFVEVFRTSDERVLEIVDAVETALDTRIRPTLPEGVEIAVWENTAISLEGRMRLLIKNAIIGLILVLTALTLFLNIRLAFWTAVGIGVAFVGTFAIMFLLGISINTISLFGFILAIGIVVDDAIVVGENIFAEREAGVAPQRAAVKGALRIRGPVIFAVLTTIVAFTPLLLVPGTFGKILKAIPLIVIAVLFLSLIESLFILPNHLSHLPPPEERARHPAAQFLERVQERVDRGLRRFIEGPLDRGLHFAVRAPSVVIAGGLALIVLAVAMVPAGILRVQFFPEVEGDVVTASLEMDEGTPAARTTEVTERIEAAGHRVAQRLEEERSDALPPLVEGVFFSVGSPPADNGPGASTGVTTAQANLATVEFKLLEAERRDISALRFEEMWREETGRVLGARSLTFTSSALGGDPDIQVELSHPDPELLSLLSHEVISELERFDGVFDIRSDESQGLREIQLSLKPAARTLGLTLDDIARQVRAAFFGDEALRVQRGTEDIRVYVRLPEHERDAIADVEEYRIRTPDGGQIPIGQVATLTLGTSPTAIRRRDGRRVVTVTARVNNAVTSADEVNRALETGVLATLLERDSNLLSQFGGSTQDQTEASGAISMGLVLALVVIYALLAIPFGSYVQPLVIMSAVPFGVVGALIGHLLLDIPVGLLSLFGIIGLSGVVVNDSLVMIDFVNENRRNGLGIHESVIDAAKSRFRPIMLTSLTTFLGVAPITFERSLQAQFLIPMAASLAFGIVFATAVLMLVVPALSTLQLQGQEWLLDRRRARRVISEPVGAGD